MSGCPNVANGSVRAPTLHSKGSKPTNWRPAYANEKALAVAAAARTDARSRGDRTLIATAK